MAKGKLIVVEGACDGIGKTTQFELLKQKLIEDGQEIMTHHFPSYNTPQGQLVSLYLSGKIGSPDELNPYMVNGFYAIDRAITWYKELKPQFEQGKTILLDRYTSSSLIYQSALIENVYEKKQFIDDVCNLEFNKYGIQQPDKVIFLEAPFDLVTKMRNGRKENDGVENDIHESNLDFMKKVYESAMFVADYLNFDRVDCCYENKIRCIDDISQEIYQLVKKK